MTRKQYDVDENSPTSTIWKPRWLIDVGNEIQVGTEARMSERRAR